jgi:hypothetical protein
MVCRVILSGRVQDSTTTVNFENDSADEGERNLAKIRQFFLEKSPDFTTIHYLHNLKYNRNKQELV